MTRVANLLTAALCLFAFAVSAQTTTWTGAMSNDWSTIGNWNNGLPSSGNDAVIPLNGTPLLTLSSNTALDYSIDNAGNLTIILSGYNLNNGGTLTNDGTVSISGEGVFSNLGLLDNNNFFFSLSTLTNVSPAQIQNAGEMSLNGTCVNFSTIDNEGTLNINEDFDNGASVLNRPTGTFNASSNFENLGVGTIDNEGTFNNVGDWFEFGTFDNSGDFYNQSNFTLSASATLNNNGSATNDDRFVNQGRLNNFGTFTNSSCQTFVGDTGSSSANMSGGVFTNNGIVRELGTADVEISAGTGSVLTDAGATPVPTMSCLPNLLLELNADGNASLSPADIDNGSTAGYCSAPSFSLSHTDFDCTQQGANIVTLTLTDGFGVSGTCQTTVTVSDNIAPVLTCPEDIVVGLQPGDCNDPITYTVTGSDNCGSAAIQQFDNSGLTSGDIFPNGTTTQQYKLSDGTSQVTCEFSVFVYGAANNGPMSCNDQVNIALGSSCEYELQANAFLIGQQVCEDAYEFLVNDEPLSTIDDSYLWQTIMVTVIHPETGNSCWANALIEDKLAPRITGCQDATLLCLNNPAPISEGGDAPEPTITDCSDFFSFYSDEIEIGQCSDSFLHRIIRTWVATDVNGMSDTCTQVLTVDKVTPSQNPPSCPADYTAECTDPNGSDISPEITGYPTVEANGNTYDLRPDNGDICNLAVSYTDSDFDMCNGSLKVLRVWKVADWCLPLGTETNPWTCNQIIYIADDTNPVVTPPADITVTVNEDCTATFDIPQATFTDCSDEISWQTQYALGTYNTNGGTVAAPGLGIGTEQITFIATDACGNSSSASMNVTIIDEVNPTAVCDADIQVVLANGVGTLPVSAVDAGSNDNCCIDSIVLVRMEDPCANPDNLTFGEEVTFCCADVGQSPMVMLRVVDCFDNVGICMVPVLVEDKEAPELICPLDVTLECSDDHTDLSLSGTPIIQDDCSGDVILTYEDEGTVGCGGGFLVRTFTATDAAGNTSTCSHFVTIIEPEALTEDDIECPEDYYITACSADISPDITGYPVVNSPACVDVAYAYDDVVFEGVGEYCQKIVRTWTMTDACYAGSNVDGGVYYCAQSIFISNTEGAVIECPSAPLELCASTPLCNAENVDLSISATDDCTEAEDLVYVWVVDLFNDGIADTGVSASGLGQNTNNDYPIGTHSITYTVKDDCDNETECTFLFTVNDCSVPSVACQANMIIELNANGTVGLNASQIQLGSVSAGCDSASDLTVSFSADTDDVNRVYSCENLNQPNPLSIVVTNSVGNQSSCTMNIQVQDNLSACTGGLMIAGAVTTENGDVVEEVPVEIMGTEMTETMTDEVGHYEYPQGSYGQSYTLTPQSGDDWMNGVTTWDLVIIRRHVLNVEPISDPYNLIAADVNNSGSIATSDIVALRSVILQFTQEFPGNTSWRYIDADYEFENPLSPWSEDYPQSLTIQSLAADDMDNDFIAVKIGDLNNSAQTNGFSAQGEERSTGDLRFKMQEKELKKGEEFDLHIYPEDAADIFAYQMTFDFNTDALEFVSLQPGPGHTLADFGLHLIEKGAITCSWDKTFFNTLNTNSSYFSVRLRAKEAVVLSEAVDINSRFTQAIAYDKNGNSFDIQLSAENEMGEAYTPANFTLYQNQPNPFRTESVISFNLPKANAVTLTVFDLSGRVVKTTEAQGTTGYNEIILQANDLPTGVLYYELRTPTHIARKKMIVAR